MDRLLVCWLIFTSVFGLRAVEPKPLLVVTEEWPRDSQLISGCPSFVLYDDGNLVCQPMESRAGIPFERRKIENLFGMLEAIEPRDFAKLSRSYDVSAGTDEVTTVIWTPRQRVRIYGNWRKPLEYAFDPSPRWKRIVDEQRKRLATLPAEIRKCLEAVDRERSIGGTLWLPPKVDSRFVFPGKEFWDQTERTGEVEDVKKPRFVVWESRSGIWSYRREWRVYEDVLWFGEPQWNAKTKTQQFAIGYSRTLTAAEFQAFADLWHRLDPRLWSQSVHFPGARFSAESPKYGLTEYSAGGSREFKVEDPIKEMMPVVQAIADLAIVEFDPRFRVTDHHYDFEPR